MHKDCLDAQETMDALDRTEPRANLADPDNPATLETQEPLVSLETLVLLAVAITVHQPAWPLDFKKPIPF